MEENERTYDLETQETTFNMSGLKLAFWGLLFTVINIRIQGFDIVPDVIGYIMVIIGLGRIEQYEDKFSAAKKMAYVLTVISLINIYQAPVQNTVNQMGIMQTTTSPVLFSAGVFGAVPWLSVLFMIAGMIANLYFVYSMCMGMKNLLKRIGDDTLARICDDRWKLILVAEVGLLISLLTVLFGLPFGMIITMLFGILALIALVLFLLLIHHAHESIDGKEVI